MLSQLHFLQPLWFLALIPLATIWWLMARSKVADSRAWAKVIDANLLPLLLSGSGGKHDSACYFGKSLLAIGWIIATFALANPVWEKIPRPVFQTNSARVIVLDLSRSMLIADLKPSRLARARFKIEDILSDNFAKKEEGQIGLVVFAGGAFTVSPLTRDSETIRALLQVLTPSIMPSQGSRVDLALKKAHELLTQAGVENGQILLIADGASNEETTLEVAKNIKEAGHSLSVLGVGTEAGGILPALKYRNGKSIIVKLDSEILEKVARRGGGKYHLISTNNADLQNVLSKVLSNKKKAQEKNDDLKSNDWKSTGPFILLLLLPLAALAFRRGWLFSIFIAVSITGFIQPQPVFAEGVAKTPLKQDINKIWKNLWENKEQQASTALKNKQYDEADTLSQNPLIRGSAKYKKDDYAGALKEFKQAQGADARYNEGNTLAKLNKYEDALKAYDKALKLQPNMADAKKNRHMIEKFLKQQKQKKHEKSDSEKKQKNGKPKNQKDKQQNKDSKNTDKDSARKEGKSGKAKDAKKNEENKNESSNNDKKSKNQFSDASKKLKKNKTNKNDSAEDNKQEETGKKPKEKDTHKLDKTNEGKKKGDKKLAKRATTKKDKDSKAKAEELNKEEKMAAEQWLRRIPDDPGGLLRQKFLRQYKRQRRPDNVKQPW